MTNDEQEEVDSTVRGGEGGRTEVSPIKTLKSRHLSVKPKFQTVFEVPHGISKDTVESRVHTPVQKYSCFHMDLFLMGTGRAASLDVFKGSVFASGMLMFAMRPWGGYLQGIF